MEKNENNLKMFLFFRNFEKKNFFEKNRIFNWKSMSNDVLPIAFVSTVDQDHRDCEQGADD